MMYSLFYMHDHQFLLVYSNSILSYSAPFDLSIVFFVIMIVYLSLAWSENYGNKQVSATVTFVSGLQLIKSGLFSTK